MTGTVRAEAIAGAEAYERLFVPALFSEWAARVADSVPVQRGSRVLDVACGTGVLAREALRRTTAVVGVDLNPAMLTVASSRAPAMTWLQAAAESLPFRDRAFDAVVSQFGLMFFADRRAALYEMCRVLKPAGRLAIAVWDSLPGAPAYDLEVGIVQRVAGQRAADGLRAPFALGDKRALTGLLAAAGLSAAEVTTHTGTARFPSIETMVEADLRGWLPLLGINLAEEQIEQILKSAAGVLRQFRQADGMSFRISAHIVRWNKPAA